MMIQHMCGLNKLKLPSHCWHTASLAVNPLGFRPLVEYLCEVFCFKKMKRDLRFKQKISGWTTPHLCRGHEKRLSCARETEPFVQSVGHIREKIAPGVYELNKKVLSWFDTALMPVCCFHDKGWGRGSALWPLWSAPRGLYTEQHPELELGGISCL